MVAVRRRLVDALVPGELGGAHADAVHLDVVGVAVAAVVVVDGEHVGVLLVEDARRAGPRPRRRRRVANEPGVVVRRLAGHARVAVAEELDAVDAEDLGGRVQLGDAPVDERLAGRERVGRVLAELAARREHEHDAMSFGLGARHRAAGRDRLRRRGARGT